MSVHSMIRFDPVPGKEEAFREELLRVSKCTRAEPGCLDINVFESLREPLIFAIHSEWVDEMAFERHAKLPHTQRFLGAAANLLTNPIQGLRLRKLFAIAALTPGESEPRSLTWVSRAGHLIEHGAW